MTRTITLTPEPVAPGGTLTICVEGEPAGTFMLTLFNGSDLTPASHEVEVVLTGTPPNTTCFQWPVPSTGWSFVVASCEHANDAAVVVA